MYEQDEDGNRIRDADGNYIFNAVPTTDWGSPETLEYWRQSWAELCNAKFAEKGLDVRIDHRSYERQGVELLPTVHEGATVRAMEKKGIGYLPVTTRQYGEECANCPYTLDEREHGVCRRCAVFKK